MVKGVHCMTGEERRSHILIGLSNSNQAITARKFAKTFGVSRQVIVGDVALLRAEGHPIVATNKGYLIKDESDGRLKKYLAVQHQKEETQEELETFVKHGIIVESVTVEHPMYGEITGYLNIETKEDVKDFLAQEPELLSTLTQGIHIHTILCPDQASYDAVKKDLANKGLLYQNN